MGGVEVPQAPRGEAWTPSPLGKGLASGEGDVPSAHSPEIFLVFFC